MILFAIATLSPALLIFAAAAFGGVWAWLAVGYTTFLAFSLDRLTPEEILNAAPQSEFPASSSLLTVLAITHIGLLACVIWAASLGVHSVTDLILLGIATTLFFGQISHPVGHELIHKPSRGLQTLGRLVYTSILFGHHASAHLKVHHIHVGSPDDPNCARPGEGFYAFAFRAWPAGFMAGLHAETRQRRAQPGWRHPYLLYIGGAIATLLVIIQIGGMTGLIAYLLISLYAQLQILMSDYVQHYGLPRHRLADGKLEPVGPQHAWNAPHWFTSAMSLNAPRHSDHHMRPGRAYPALQLDEDKMPCLPYSLPVMAGIALIPPVWRRVMDPRCARWQPVWIDTPRPGARDIPPAVLEHAKPGGPGGRILPVSPHAIDDTSPVPDTDGTSGARQRSDDGG